MTSLLYLATGGLDKAYDMISEIDNMESPRRALYLSAGFDD